MDQSAEREWHCSQCGTLLGVEKGGRLHLKVKAAQFVVQVGSWASRCSPRSGELPGGSRRNGQPDAWAKDAWIRRLTSPQPSLSS